MPFVMEDGETVSREAVPAGYNGDVGASKNQTWLVTQALAARR